MVSTKIIFGFVCILICVVNSNAASKRNGVQGKHGTTSSISPLLEYPNGQKGCNCNDTGCNCPEGLDACCRMGFCCGEDYPICCPTVCCPVNYPTCTNGNTCNP